MTVSSPLPGTEADDGASSIHIDDDTKTRGRVNMPKRWTHIRIPVELAERINRLAEQTLAAHAEGRITLPTEMAERVPAWFVVENALDEQEARRERSRRPRARVATST